MAVDRCRVVAKGVGAELVERVTGIEPASRAWKARPGAPLTLDAAPMRSSACLTTDRCCPWGAVRDRCYGHVEGTAGEDQAGSGVTATVTSWTGG
jgi:hypothetical protein